MSEITLLLIFTFLSLSLILLIFYLLKKCTISFQSFLNLQTNIMVVTTIDKTLFINRAGLEFFDCENFQEFKEKFTNIINLFIEEEG